MHRQSFHIIELAAAAIMAAAFLLFAQSCKSTTEITDYIDISTVPRQVGDSIYAVNSVNGEITLRLEAPRMEKYETDTSSYELFPSGFDVFSYNKADLETHIHSKAARHTITKHREETWEVFGNVVITNHINGQVLKTDTLYWDRYNHRIFTHCFVEMSSPQGFMQGYGMESDEQARHAEILRPFNSFSRIEEDSLYLDTANFIGPILDKSKIGRDLKIKGKE